MDCEKFDDALMDELYGELDEVTSAALRRHASSCPRCAERLGSMRATRKVLASSFGPVDPPADLEEKIFAAAAEARKVVPIRSRMTRFVSVAGRWAMRPQTAMAAVFLLMIGSSVVLMRGSSKSMSPVVVTERGAPADVAPEPAAAAVADNNKEFGGANAHGIEQSAAKTPVAAATATVAPNAEAKVATSPAASAMGPIAMMDKKSESADPTGFIDDTPRRSAVPRTAAREEARPPAKPSQQPSPPPAAVAPAEIAAASPMPAAPGAPPAAIGKGSSAATGSGAGGASPADSTSPFADAMAAYRAQRYAEATRGFDALAQQGDPNAALWAARSELRSSGCASAVGRFDRIVASSYGTPAGYDAALEAGRCYRALGSFDVARARFQRLLTVPSHAARAQAELDAMSPKAKRAAPSDTL